MKGCHVWSKYLDLVCDYNDMNLISCMKLIIGVRRGGGGGGDAYESQVVNCFMGG